MKTLSVVFSAILILSLASDADAGLLRRRSRCSNCAPANVASPQAAEPLSESGLNFAPIVAGDHKEFFGQWGVYGTMVFSGTLTVDPQNRNAYNLRGTMVFVSDNRYLGRRSPMTGRLVVGIAGTGIALTLTRDPNGPNRQHITFSRREDYQIDNLRYHKFEHRDERLGRFTAVLGNN